MSKLITHVIACAYLLFGVNTTYGRESKAQKLEHAKNLQNALYQIDTRIINFKGSFNESDKEALSESFSKISVKLINKKEVKRILDSISKFSSIRDLRSHRQYLEKIFRIRISSSYTPSKEKGKNLYIKHCASCHGDTGDGKGVFAERLNPKPTNFLTKEFKEAIVPHMIFNYAVHGIPSGVMKPLSEALDYKNLWNLSYYVTAMPFEKDIKSAERPLKELSFSVLASKDLSQLREEKIAEKSAHEVYIRAISPFKLELKRR